MKFALAVVVALVAGPALAQSSAMPAQQHAATGKTVEGAGLVKAVDAKAGTVTLHHGPIAAINWPAMTMKFKAAPEVLKGLKTGQTVSFTLDPAANQIISAKPK